MSSCWHSKGPNQLINIHKSLFVATTTFPHRHRSTFSWCCWCLLKKEYSWNRTQPNKSPVGCKQSVRGLIYCKQPVEGWCYQGVPCDHQGTCVPAAGVTQHLDLPSSLLSVCVCVCCTYATHKHTHRGCPVPVVAFGVDPDGVINQPLCCRWSTVDAIARTF